MPKLTYLDVRSNDFGDDGAVVLVDALVEANARFDFASQVKMLNQRARYPIAARGVSR